MNIPKDRENGMITVEGVLCLVPFIMVILGIISFINVFVVHNKIQYAMQELGSELTAYTYFYQVFGLHDAQQALSDDLSGYSADMQESIDQVTGFMTDLESMISGITLVKDDVNGLAVNDGSIEDLMDNANRLKEDAGNLAQDMETVYEDGAALVDKAKYYISDPKEILRELFAIFMDKGSDFLKTKFFELIAPSLMRVYLDMSFSETQSLSADEYLKYFGVKDGLDGLDFGHSHLFSWDKEGETENVRSKMIDIVVEYKIEIPILKLFLKDPTIDVVQRCAMPAWLDGDGVKFEGE